MRNKLIVLLALILCTGAFLLPVPTFASDINIRPVIITWILEDELNIEAAENSPPVEAVFINENRVEYDSENGLHLVLSDYVTTDEPTLIYAIDFSGNQSVTTMITVSLDEETSEPNYELSDVSEVPFQQNPFSLPGQEGDALQAEELLSLLSLFAQTGVLEQSSPYMFPEQSDPYASQDSISQTEPSEQTEPTEPPVQTNPFTPSGQASVVDQAADSDGKDFYTFTTPEGNVFYLVIDHQRNSENVYFLNAVTESDLLALAENSGKKGTAGAIPTPAPVPTPTPEPPQTPQPEQPEPTGMNTTNIIFIVVAIVVLSGVGFYIKVVRPKQNPPVNSIEPEDDEDEDEMELPTEDDSDEDDSDRDENPETEDDPS